MQILGNDENGNPTINYDSRWRWPDLFGYSKGDPGWTLLQQKYMNITGITIDEDGNVIGKEVQYEKL